MKKLLLLTLFILVGAIQVNAQVKVGYTNPEVILSRMPEIQEIDQQIGQMLTEKDSLLAIKAADLQKMIEDYEAAKNSMSAEARLAREQQLIEKNAEFEQERENSLNEVQQKQLALINPVKARVFEAIQAVADELGLDMVLNEGSVNGGAIIFYADDAQKNITELVLEKLKQS